MFAQTNSHTFSEPRFESRAEFHVVGLYIEDTMESQAIMDLWINFFKNKHKISAKTGKGEYGITSMLENYDPETHMGYRYIVGTRVKNTKNVPKNMIAHTVPEAYYAIFEHHGLINSVDTTFSYIFGEWLPRSGYEVVQKDIFEYYDSRFKHNSEDSIMEIWVPVTKKADQPQE
jgi:AraC family transcriptional regulator